MLKENSTNVHVLGSGETNSPKFLRLSRGIIVLTVWTWITLPKKTINFSYALRTCRTLYSQRNELRLRNAIKIPPQTFLNAYFPNESTRKIGFEAKSMSALMGAGDLNPGFSLLHIRMPSPRRWWDDGGGGGSRTFDPRCWPDRYLGWTMLVSMSRKTINQFTLCAKQVRVWGRRGDWRRFLNPSSSGWASNFTPTQHHSSFLRLENDDNFA